MLTREGTDAVTVGNALVTVSSVTAVVAGRESVTGTLSVTAALSVADTLSVTIGVDAVGVSDTVASAMVVALTARASKLADVSGSVVPVSVGSEAVTIAVALAVGSESVAVSTSVNAPDSVVVGASEISGDADAVGVAVPVSVG